jgi:hypothetical protein
MAAYRVPEHIWRTTDGRLVLTGDPAAAVLAYARGDEMSDDEARRRGIVDAVEGRPVREVGDKPAGSKVSGVTINRAKKETPHG